MRAAAGRLSTEGIALDNGRLHAELRARVQELAGSIDNGLDVVGTCETAEGLLLMVERSSPDVAIADSTDGVGYLLKDRISDVKDFVAAVRRIATGRWCRRPRGRRHHGGAVGRAGAR